ncbi:MAG: AbrB/MazE/SpoVT family DNA-binding domain-containing protein [Myxococcota bacterium]
MIEPGSNRIQSSSSGQYEPARAFAVRITRRGQVTIPAGIREKLGLLRDSEVEFEVVGQAVQMRKVRRARKPFVAGGRSSGDCAVPDRCE